MSEKSNARNCFLIADEVGLGKTRTARAIAHEMMKYGDVRMLYVCSNQLIIKQNMKDFENLHKPKAEDYLANYQEETVKRTLRVFGFSSVKPEKHNRISRILNEDKNEDEDKNKDKGKNKNRDRLSKFNFQREDGNWVMAVSHATSFNTDNNEKVRGDKYERNIICAALKVLKDIKLDKVNINKLKFNGKSLIIACWYYIDTIIGKKKIKSGIFNSMASDKNNKNDVWKKFQDMIYSEEYEEKKNAIRNKLDPDLYWEMHTILSNSATINLRPNLIVLDEFQRFRMSLLGKDNGKNYSVKDMVDFINWYNSNLNGINQAFGVKDDADKFDGIQTPKILLLSATPYQYNLKAQENVFSEEVQNKDNQYLSDLNDEGNYYMNQDKENGFEDFSNLCDAINSLEKSNVSNVKDFMSRTERSMFFTENDRHLYVDSSIKPDSIELRKHYKYLSEIYNNCSKLPGFEAARDAIDACILHTPHFWHFVKGYKSLGLGINKPEEFSKNLKVGPENHILMQTLSKETLPEGIENLLWVLPSVKYDDVQLGEYGKTLVFTRYKMTARAVAYYQCEEIKTKQGDTSITENPNFNWENPSVKEQLRNLSMDKWLKDIINGQDCSEQITQAFTRFFKSRYVKNIITKTMGGYDLDKIDAYCKRYYLNLVLKEYRSLFENEDKFIETLCEVLGMENLGKISYITNAYKNDEGIFEFVPKDAQGELDFAVRYTDDPEDNKGHNALFATRFQDRFNSPFYPMVMVATETAQEGLNLHYYADRLMHWHIAGSTSGFMQREGRIDRPNSLVIRRRLIHLAKKSGVIKDSDVNFKELENNAYQMLRKCCENTNIELLTVIEAAFKAGIAPKWYLPIIDKDTPQIKRILGGTLLDGGKEKDNIIKNSVKQYPKFSASINGTEATYKEKCAFWEYKDLQS